MKRYKPNHTTIKNIIRTDADMMRLLSLVRDLHLPDWYIGAGFVRNKVWNVLSKKTQSTKFEDIDVIYFNSKNTDEKTDKDLEKILTLKCPTQKWSVKNQARMWKRNGDQPYQSSEHAIQHWPETVTAIAVTLGVRSGLKIISPYGFKDLFSFTVRPTPIFAKKMDIFHERQKAKQWQKQWTQITYEITDEANLR